MPEPTDLEARLARIYERDAAEWADLDPPVPCRPRPPATASPAGPGSTVPSTTPGGGAPSSRHGWGWAVAAGVLLAAGALTVGGISAANPERLRDEARGRARGELEAATEADALRAERRNALRRRRLGYEVVTRLEASVDFLAGTAASGGDHRLNRDVYVHDRLCRPPLKEKDGRPGGPLIGVYKEFEDEPTCNLFAELVGLTPDPDRQALKAVLRDLRQFAGRYYGFDQARMGEFEAELAKVFPELIRRTKDVLEKQDGR